MLLFFWTKAQDYYESYPPRKKERTPSAEKKFNLNFSHGPAFPSKDFKSTTAKNSYWDFNSADSVKLTGFAKTGYNFNLSASYLFTDNLGIMIMIGSNINAFDIGTFNSVVRSTSVYSNYPFTTSGTYYTNEYLIGPYLSSSEWHRIKIQGYALFGLVTSTYPDIAMQYADTTIAFNFNSGKSFGYCLGGAIAVSLNDWIDLALNVSYTQATLSYPGVTINYSAPGYYPFTDPHPDDVTKMQLGILKITTGVVFKLF